MSKPICHMTHIRNLPTILSEGGLWCDRQAKDRSLTQQGIGHGHIKDRRSRWPVNVGAGRVLGDYVPFYFHHHSPMLYVIYRNGVVGYEGGQDEVIYLTSSTDVIDGNDLSFVFTDGSAIVALSEQLDELSDLDKLDWSVIQANQWADTNADGDRMRRKQAEFLVHHFMPWPLITGIVVRTQSVAEQIATALEGQSYIPPMQIMSAWYY